MKRWREKRKERKRTRSGKSNFWYELLDLLIDISLWVPELVLFPLRVIYWFVRGFSRALKHLFDNIIDWIGF
ncbi:hypothetical protein ACW2QC_11425 [Virgibacillus sp. FSP13]